MIGEICPTGVFLIEASLSVFTEGFVRRTVYGKGGLPGQVLSSRLGVVEVELSRVSAWRRFPSRICGSPW